MNLSVSVIQAAAQAAEAVAAAALVNSTTSIDELLEFKKELNLRITTTAEENAQLMSEFVSVTKSENPQGKSGYSDVPQWRKYGIAQRNRIRAIKMNEFAAQLKTHFHSQPNTKPTAASTTPPAKVAKRKPASTIKPAQKIAPTPAPVAVKLEDHLFALAYSASRAIEVYRANPQLDKPAVDVLQEQLQRVLSVKPLSKTHIQDIVAQAASKFRNEMKVLSSNHGGFTDSPGWYSMTVLARTKINVAKLTDFMQRVTDQAGRK